MAAHAPDELERSVAVFLGLADAPPDPKIAAAVESATLRELAEGPAADRRPHGSTGPGECRCGPHGEETQVSATEKMMRVVERPDGWWIVQKGWKDHGPHATEAVAYSWADSNIDDQVFGDPNALAEEKRERAD